tara:strand:- start:97 stop:1017 length:921 start_codon:yes stop_codon:yes gene_type:complete
MYKNNGSYYTSVQLNGKRLQRSLHTKNKKVAKSREPKVKNLLYNEILTGKKKDPRKLNPGLKAMVEMFLRKKRKERVSPNTYNTYKYTLRPWVKRQELPPNKNTAMSWMRMLNAFFKWANANYKDTDFELYTDIGQAVRSRVFTGEEKGGILGGIVDCGVVVVVGSLYDYQDFVRLAYYTGCRRAELAGLKKENILEDKMLVSGKTGERWVKLNSQAREVLERHFDKLWDYKLDWISKTFSRCMFAMGIENAIFHDLRRTFGYDLIRQGMPIYQVSKLLGHRSVVTTERHYAPLLATEVDDFTLKW